MHTTNPTPRRIRRAVALAVALVVGVSGSAWAGCPPVDVQRCEVLHEEVRACRHLDDVTD